jgi:hypothetical protein
MEGNTMKKLIKFMCILFLGFRLGAFYEANSAELEKKTLSDLNLEFTQWVIQQKKNTKEFKEIIFEYYELLKEKVLDDELTKEDRRVVQHHLSNIEKVYLNLKVYNKKVYDYTNLFFAYVIQDEYSKYRKNVDRYVDIDTLIRIMLLESRGVVNAKRSNSNGTRDYGWYQINDFWLSQLGETPESIMMPRNNVAAALVVLQETKSFGSFCYYHSHTHFYRTRYCKKLKRIKVF